MDRTDVKFLWRWWPLRVVVGAILIILGLIGVIVPIMPGLIFIIPGSIIIAREFTFFRSLIAGFLYAHPWVRRKIGKAFARVRKKTGIRISFRPPDYTCKK